MPKPKLKLEVMLTTRLTRPLLQRPRAKKEKAKAKEDQEVLLERELPLSRQLV